MAARLSSAWLGPAPDLLQALGLERAPLQGGLSQGLSPAAQRSHSAHIMATSYHQCTGLVHLRRRSPLFVLRRINCQVHGECGGQCSKRAYLAHKLGLLGSGRCRDPVAAAALPRVRAKETEGSCEGDTLRMWPYLADIRPVLPSCA